MVWFFCGEFIYILSLLVHLSVPSGQAKLFTGIDSQLLEEVEVAAETAAAAHSAAAAFRCFHADPRFRAHRRFLNPTSSELYASVPQPVKNVTGGNGASAVISLLRNLVARRRLKGAVPTE